MERKVAEILLDIGAVTLSPKKPYRFVSGILSPIYTDCRILMGFPKKRQEIIDCMARVVKEKNSETAIDVIAGVASSGIPHAAWLSDRLAKPMIYVRKGEKDHGKQSLIEGILKDGNKVLLIEDLISTGGSSLNAVNTIRASKGIVENCLAIFTYEIPKSKESFEQNNVRLRSLTNLSTLIEVAVKTGKIEENEKDIVLDWARDTVGWGKKQGFK